VSPGLRSRERVPGERPQLSEHHPDTSAGQQGLKIAGVRRLAKEAYAGPQLIGRDPTLAEGNLLQAGNLQALTVFDDVDELGGLDQGVVRARVQPGRAAAEQLNMELASLEIEAIEVRDLQFTAGGG